MNKIKHLPKSIPDKSNKFSLKAKGSLSGEEYSGDFECKIPNLRDQALIAKNKAFLNGGMEASLDKATKNLHHMVSYCKYTLISCPDWFAETDFGYDLFDQNIVEEVFNKILESEELWLNSVWGDKEDERK